MAMEMPENVCEICIRRAAWADGTTLVRKPDDVKPDDLIQTRLASGQITSRVLRTASRSTAG